MDMGKEVSDLRCLECKMLVTDDCAITCCRCLSIFHDECVPNPKLEDGKEEWEIQGHWMCEYCITVSGFQLGSQSKPDSPEPDEDPEDLEGWQKILPENVTHELSEDASLSEDSKKLLEKEVESEEADPPKAEKNAAQCVCI